MESVFCNAANSFSSSVFEVNVNNSQHIGKHFPVLGNKTFGEWRLERGNESLPFLICAAESFQLLYQLFKMIERKNVVFAFA